jgi:hypothetical protein
VGGGGGGGLQVCCPLVQALGDMCSQKVASPRVPKLDLHSQRSSAPAPSRSPTPIKAAASKKRELSRAPSLVGPSHKSKGVPGINGVPTVRRAAKLAASTAALREPGVKFAAGGFRVAGIRMNYEPRPLLFRNKANCGGPINLPRQVEPRSRVQGTTSPSSSPSFA